MKTQRFLYFLNIFVFLFSLLLARPVLAHGDDPRIEISPDRLNPGMVLDIRGVDFGFEQQVNLSLVSSQFEISLGSILADADGIFLVNITLPVDLAEGTYIVRAKTDDHVVESPQLVVSGTANLGNDEDGQRSEEDLLLAPMPNTLSGASTAVPPTPVLPKSIPARNPSSSWAWILAGIGAIVVLGVILKVSRSS
jgi:hypothetical protein